MKKSDYGKPAKIYSNLFRLIIYMAVILLILVNNGCSGSIDSGKNQSAPDRKFCAAVWNMQALFDSTENGNEYEEYRESAGWTSEKYRARLLAAARAITQMRSIAENLPAANTEKLTAPDFIGLVEMENAEVLNDLLMGPLSQQGYIQSFYGSAPAMSLGLGVLSRYPLTETRVHSITTTGETIPRPILEVSLAPGGNSLVIFLCHWKSKVGGDDATESLRRASAAVISRRIRELKTEKPGTPVIIMGDLNENHDEFYRRGGKIPYALLPDDPGAALLADKNKNNNYFLIVSKEKPPKSTYFDKTNPVLYTPWETEITGGSYWYRDNWETIDHILMSAELFDNKGWEFGNALVLNAPPFTNTRGIPNTYNPKTGLGISDHLPLMLYLRAAPE
ncbi:MAG: endonuclease/exonuclease/phosphatase family protein [Treponema sp.]|nr:endonuclease/exonuclease/phosphatase family protein [Treponema sp.]